MNGDIQALQVILTLPAYLLGLDQETVSTVRETARKSVTPAPHRAYEIGNKGRDLMEIAMKARRRKPIPRVDPALVLPLVASAATLTRSPAG